MVPLCDRSILQSLARAVQALKDQGVEAIAICFLNSFLNDQHERVCHELIARQWPGIWISCSSQVAPIMGEYERVSTTVVDACIAPRVVPYLRALDERLRKLGLTRPLALVQSNGGIVSVDQITARPVTLVLSGPAAGVGTIRSLSRIAGSADLICIEIGGTSCDVIMMHAGEIAMTDQLDVAGYHVNIPSVEIHTIGTGGGTIAGVDRGGMLWVGPHGAGARPGPACYGLGGEEPTVTDAQLVLGRLKPGSHAGGLIQLDDGLAAAAIERGVARPLGVDNTSAAAGMIRLMEQKVRHAVERVSIERGYDPARFTLVAGGGAGAMHAAAVARALGCRGVYVPRLAGVFCAFGMCHSDVRHDYVQSWLGDLDATDENCIEAAFGALVAKGHGMLLAEGFMPDQVGLQRFLDLKYVGQQWSIPVAIVPGFDPRAIRAAFEENYSRLYGHHQPDGRIEIQSLRLAATGLLPALDLVAEETVGRDPVPCEIRDAYVDERHGRQPVRIYDGIDLRPGQTILGPAIVEEGIRPLSSSAQMTSGGRRQRQLCNHVRLGSSPMIDDPIRLSLVQKQLDHVARQMGWVMMRTARSPIFSQSHDFSCFIGDAQRQRRVAGRWLADPHRWRRFCRQARVARQLSAGRSRMATSTCSTIPTKPATTICRTGRSYARYSSMARCGVFLQSRPPVRHRRRRCRHLQCRRDRNLS